MDNFEKEIKLNLEILSKEIESEVKWLSDYLNTSADDCEDKMRSIIIRGKELEEKRAKFQALRQIVDRAKRSK